MCLRCRHLENVNFLRTSVCRNCTTTCSHPRKNGAKILIAPPTCRARTLCPAATPCSSSALSECRCYPRLPAGGYLTTTSRVQGADASTASTRVQRTADHRRAHQVVDETPSTGPPCPPRVRAAPPARSQGVCAPSGEAPRVHHTHSTTGAHVRACCIVLVACDAAFK